jgi:uncharacterized protein (TIGR03000 family)
MWWCLSLLFAAGPICEAEAKYYVTVYSYQSEPLRIRNTHTFAHFVKKTPLTVEEQTISWMPASLRIAVLSRLPERGVNLSLEQTFQLAESMGARVTNHGLFEITRELYDRATNQIKRLGSGQVQYKCVDRRIRGIASNCIHAVSDVAGDLDTGTQSGAAATAVVVQHLASFVVRPSSPRVPTQLVLASVRSEPANQTEGLQQPALSNIAIVQVSVPEDAKVWIDGRETHQLGADRVFQSPPVIPDKEYFYEVSAQWRDSVGNEVAQKRNVTVWANRTVHVSFMSNSLATESTLASVGVTP